MTDRNRSTRRISLCPSHIPHQVGPDQQRVSAARGWRLTAWAGRHSLLTPEVYLRNIFLQKVKCSRYRPGVAQRVGRGIALLFHDRGTRRGWGVSVTPRPHFTPGKGPVLVVQEAGWAPGQVWTGGKSRHHQDSIPDLQPVVNRYTDWATRPTGVAQKVPGS